MSWRNYKVFMLYCGCAEATQSVRCALRPAAGEPHKAHKSSEALRKANPGIAWAAPEEGIGPGAHSLINGLEAAQSLFASVDRGPVAITRLSARLQD